MALDARQTDRHTTGMRIAIGIFRLLPRGGLEDHCVRISEELARRGHRVTVFATGVIPELELTTRQLPRRGRSNHASMLAFGKAFMEASRQGFDRRVAFQPVPGADLIVLADPVRGGRQASWWKRILPRQRTYAAIEKVCFAQEAHTRIIGFAAPQMRELVATYSTPPDRIAVLPPTVSPRFGGRVGTSEEERKVLRHELGIPADGALWLWAGLQPHVKGLDRTIDALARAPGARLLVAGIAEDHPKLKPYLKRAVRIGVRCRLHPLGFLGPEAMTRAFSAADALVHPARHDVTGTVILEALVNGTPVVSTGPCGYSTHVARSGAGLVLPEPFDPGTFDAALAEVCGSSNRLLSKKGIAYGKDPSLFSGIACAAALIEARLDRPWPVKANGASLDP